MSLLGEARAAWRDFSDVGATTHASSISYYTFFSLIPLLAISISLLSVLGIDEREVYEFLSAFVPGALSDLADTMVTDAYARSGLALSLSSISLVWSASKGTKALRVGLNAAYGEQETRNAVAVAAISVAAVIVMSVLLAAAAWLIFGNSVLHILSEHIPSLRLHRGALEFADVIGVLGAGMIVLTLCYTFLPAGARRLEKQLSGAACALAGCVALTLGFRVYVEHFSNFTVLYGSIATVALLLFWMYLLFYIVLAGGFVNHYLQGRGEVTAAASE